MKYPVLAARNRDEAADLESAIARVTELERQRDEALDHIRDLADVCDTIDGEMRNRRLIAHEKAVKAWWRLNGFPNTPEAWISILPRRVPSA